MNRFLFSFTFNIIIGAKSTAELEKKYILIVSFFGPDSKFLLVIKIIIKDIYKECLDWKD